jgi:hypothetical protein
VEHNYNQRSADRQRQAARATLPTRRTQGGNRISGTGTNLDRDSLDIV